MGGVLTRTWERLTRDWSRIEARIDGELAEELSPAHAVLVGAVRDAGPHGVDLLGDVRRAAAAAAPGDPLAHRAAVEYLWHVLATDPREPVRWNLPADVHAVHTAQLRDWCDRPERTAAQVEDLRGAALARVAADLRRLGADPDRPSVTFDDRGH